MKEGSLSTLKNQLCSQDKWQKDLDKCPLCHKDFIIFVRRRHHCRFCGKIFCSNCSDHFIHGQYIDASLQHYLRLCNPCFNRIEKEIKQVKSKQRSPTKQKNSLILEKKQPTYISQQQSDQSTTKCTETLQYQSDIPSESGRTQQLNIDIRKKIQFLTKQLCNQQNIIDLFWIETLSKIALQAIADTKIDTLKSDDSMDVSQHIKIHTLLTNDCNATRYVKGYVASKNIINKHMQKYFVNPKIMMIAKSLQIDQINSQKMSFQELVMRQKNILKKRVDQIIQLKPNIVFVQEKANISALQQLQANKITVIQNIKSDVFANIQKAARVKKIIKRIQRIQKYHPQDIVGTCQKIYFQTYQNQDSQQTKTLMIMQNQVGMTSVILADTQKNKLYILSTIMKKILRATRHLYLEKYLIDIELNIMNKFKQGNFCTFLDENDENIMRFYQRTNFKYTRINYQNTKFSNFIDVGKQDLIAYYHNLTYNTHWAINQQSEICLQPEYKQFSYYTSDDLALGTYLSLKMQNSDRKCENCYLPRSKHQTIYYHKNSQIKIQLVINQKKPITNKKILQQNMFQNYDNILTKENKHHILGQNKKINFNEFYTYIECQECKNKLSQSFLLKRNYLQFSFLHFLQKLFISHNIQNQIIKIQNIKDNQCKHQLLTRVFQYENSLVKFTIETLLVYQLDKIDFKSAESISYVNQTEEKFVRNLIVKQFSGLKTSSHLLLQYFKTSCKNILLTSSLNPTNNILNSPKMVIITQSMSKLKQILQKINSEIQEINSISFYEKFNQNIYLTYSYLIKKSHQYFFLTESIIKIIEQIQCTIKKYKNSGQYFQDIVIKNDSQLRQSVKKNQLANQKLDAILEHYRTIRWPIQDQNLKNYLPVYANDPISLIAYALNTIKLNQINQQILNQKEIKIKVQFTDNCIFESKINQQLETIKINLKLEKSKKQMKDDIFEVTVFHHKQFQIIRKKESLQYQDFINAIIGCASWDTTGGKSCSRFAKSYNDLVVVKIINDKQFIEFRKFVSQYTTYINDSKDTSSNGSLLAKIFGMFEVNIKGKVYNCIAMQNIFFQLKVQDQIVYDLKGSETNRFQQPHFGKLFTGLDTNFKVDRNSEPISLKPLIYNQVIQTLENDCKFLAGQMVIDYSLLLIINNKTNKIRLGIIDFMRPYHIKEKLQTIYKEIKTGGSVPTVIPPKQYSQRFIFAMKKYFIKVED